jgi:hypothetical protein
VRAAILDSIEHVLRRGSTDNRAKKGRVYEMVIEHEAMHQETLLYMLQLLPGELKMPHEDLPSFIKADLEALAARNREAGEPVSAEDGE